MKIPAIARVLALIGLCALAVPIMGGGTECPKGCIIAGTECELTCGGAIGKCVAYGEEFVCEPPDEEGPGD